MGLVGKIAIEGVLHSPILVLLFKTKSYISLIKKKKKKNLTLVNFS